MRNKTGLTLTELMLACMLLGLVVLTAVAVNINATRFLSSESNQAQLANMTSLTLERVSKDILFAFGNPPGLVNPAFAITNGGNQLELRIRDIAPAGPDANDGWVAYRLTANQLEFNSDFNGVNSNWQVIAQNLVNTNPLFQISANIIRMEITCRQNISQPVSTANPEVTLVSSVQVRGCAAQ